MLDLLEEPKALELLVRKQMEFKIKTEEKNTVEEYINKHISNNDHRETMLAWKNDSKNSIELPQLEIIKFSGKL